MVIGSRGRSARVTSAPLVTPASREPGGLQAAGDGEQPVDQAAQPLLLEPGELLGGHRLGAGLEHGRDCLTADMCGSTSRWHRDAYDRRLMTTVPDRSRVRLPGISSRAYEHPADRSALVALRKLTGFDVILKNLAGLFSDRACG